jgi:hypothetical protein
VLAAATKLNADLRVACEAKAEDSACQQITSSTELLQTAFTYLQQESAQLKVLMTLPHLVTF